MGQTHPKGNQLYISPKLGPLGVLSTIYDIIAKPEKEGEETFLVPLGLVGLVPFASQERHHFAWIGFALVSLFLEEFGLWGPHDFFALKIPQISF